MTDEYSSYCEPELPEFDPTECSVWNPTQKIQHDTKKKSTGGYSQLLDGDVRRIAPQCGPDTVAVFAVIALHADEQGLAYPSLRTIARMCDIGDLRTVKAHIRKLVVIGSIEHATKNGKPGFRVIHGDGSRGFTPLIRRFIEDYVAPHDDLRNMEIPAWIEDSPDDGWVGPRPRRKIRYVTVHPVISRIGSTGLGFYYGVIAAARGAGACCRDGRMKFRMRVEELRALLGMSRGQFDRVRKVVEVYGLLESTQLGKTVEWDVRVQGSSQKMQPEIVTKNAEQERSSQILRDSPRIVTNFAEQAPGSSQILHPEVDLDLEVDFKAEEDKSFARSHSSDFKTDQPTVTDDRERVRSVVVVADCRGNQCTIRDARDTSQRPAVRLCEDSELQAVLMHARREGSPVLIYVEHERIVEARAFAEVVDEVCADLYAVTPQKSSLCTSFHGRQRQAIRDLLHDRSGEDIVRAFREFVHDFDNFQMRNAPTAFLSGGAKDVFAKWGRPLRYQEQGNAKAAKAEPPQHRPEKQETHAEELARRGLEQMQELAEAMANPLRTWQPSGQAA